MRKLTYTPYVLTASEGSEGRETDHDLGARSHDFSSFSESNVKCSEVSYLPGGDSSSPSAAVSPSPGSGYLTTSSSEVDTDLISLSINTDIEISDFGSQ